MPREHAEPVNGQFDTPFGPMDFALTSGSHVHISAGSSYDQSPKIIVNNIPYHVSLHLALNDDGWHPQLEIYMTREVGNDASTPARRKAKAGIMEAWAAFADEQLLIEGELRHLNNEIGKAEEDIGELKHKIDKRNQDIQGLLGREQEAYEARAKYTRKGGFPRPKDWSPTGDVPE